jgi:uncharacterized protein with HEPN domain
MRPDDAALLDMLLAARKASEYVADVTLQSFYADEILQDAAIRQVMVIGEAASQVSVMFREAHPEVDWEGIINMRHRLVHDYRHINRAIVWQAATREAPALVKLLEPLVPTEGR